MNTQTNYEAHPDFTAFVAAKERADRAQSPHSRDPQDRRFGTSILTSWRWRPSQRRRNGDWRARSLERVSDPALAAVSQFLERRGASVEQGV